MIITSTVEATPYTSRWFQTQNGLHSAPNLKVPLVMYEFVINKKNHLQGHINSFNSHTYNNTHK